jgi:hypothetical protein
MRCVEAPSVKNDVLVKSLLRFTAQLFNRHSYVKFMINFAHFAAIFAHYIFDHLWLDFNSGSSSYHVQLRKDGLEV